MTQGQKPDPRREQRALRASPAPRPKAEKPAPSPARQPTDGPRPAAAAPQQSRTAPQQRPAGTAGSRRLPAQSGASGSSARPTVPVATDKPKELQDLHDIVDIADVPEQNEDSGRMTLAQLSSREHLRRQSSKAAAIEINQETIRHSRHRSWIFMMGIVFAPVVVFLVWHFLRPEFEDQAALVRQTRQKLEVLSKALSKAKFDLPADVKEETFRDQLWEYFREAANDREAERVIIKSSSKYVPTVTVHPPQGFHWKVFRSAHSTKVGCFTGSLLPRETQNDPEADAREKLALLQKKHILVNCVWQESDNGDGGAYTLMVGALKQPHTTYRVRLDGMVLEAGDERTLPTRTGALIKIEKIGRPARDWRVFQTLGALPFPQQSGKGEKYLRDAWGRNFVVELTQNEYDEPILVLASKGLNGVREPNGQGDDVQTAPLLMNFEE